MERIVGDGIPETNYPPQLLALIRHDAANDSDLVKVLGAYLKDDLSSSQTARDLYIHRNTLLNRIKQIKSVGNIDFQDKHQVLLLQIAYALMDRSGASTELAE